MHYIFNATEFWIHESTDLLQYTEIYVITGTTCTSKNMVKLFFVFRNKDNNFQNKTMLAF